MNTAEKISVLETLLVRVQQRATQARPARSNAVVADESLHAAPEAPPVIAQPAVVAAPPATAAIEPPQAAAAEVTAVAAAVEEPAPEPRKSAPVAAPAPVMTRTSSGSYVAKGGMSEELPDFDLEEEEEQGEEEIILEQSAPAASEQAEDDDREAEEFAIPLRPSVQMRAIVAPTPIEVSTDDSELEIDHTPLASALPASTEEAIALQARRIPSSSLPSVPGDLDLEVSPASLSAPALELNPAPQFNTPAISELDEPEETLVSNAISLPEERAEEPAPEVAIPLVAAVAKPEPALAAPTPVAAPTVATPTPAAPVAAPVIAKPALVPAPTSAVVPAPPPAPVAKVTEPVVHEAPPIAEAQAIEIVAEIPAPTAPLTFGALLRKSLSLRVK